MNAIKYLFAAAALAMAVTSSAGAATIDTNPTWDGNVNFGWGGSGQSLSVVAGDSHLDNISFYFDPGSVGQSFTFTLSDAVTGGTTFFSSTFSVLDGINTFLTDLDLTPSSTVYALFDYNGFSGSTAHFSFINGYDGGHSFFFSGGTWNTSFTSLDHRFIANFSGPAAVPVPAALPLLLLALGGLGVAARRRRT